SALELGSALEPFRLPGRPKLFPRLAAERDHGRPGRLRRRAPHDGRIRHCDDSYGGSVDGLPVEREGGLTGHDEIELLLPARRLVMRTEQVASRLTRHIDVRSERREPEVVLERIPLRIAGLFYGDAGDVLEPADREARHGQSGEMSGTSRPSCSMRAFQRW